MDPTVLFQLIFTFIYNTFIKKFSVLAKQSDLKQTLNTRDRCVLLGLLPLEVLFMGLIILFQLIFTFIYSTFSKKFSVSAK